MQKKIILLAILTATTLSHAQLIGNETDLRNDIISSSNDSVAHPTLKKNEYWVRGSVVMRPNDILPGKRLLIKGHPNGTTIYHGAKLESYEPESSDLADPYAARLPNPGYTGVRVVDLSEVASHGWVGAWPTKILSTIERDIHRGLEIRSDRTGQMPVFAIGNKKLRYAEANIPVGDNLYGWRRTMFGASSSTTTFDTPYLGDIQPDGVRAIMFHSQDYASWNVAVSSVLKTIYRFEPSRSNIELAVNPFLAETSQYYQGANQNLSQEQRFTLINVPEKLDEPGEFVIDLAGKKMYFIPVPGYPLDVTVGLPNRLGQNSPLVAEAPLQIGDRMSSPSDTVNKGFNGVDIADIKFDSAMGGQLVLWNNNDVNIWNTEFRNMGRFGLRLNRNTNVNVQYCSFRGSDQWHIDMTNYRGFEGGAFLAPLLREDIRLAGSHNINIEGCLFESSGQVYPESPSIISRRNSSTGLFGVAISECIFGALPGTAVLLDGVNNTVEYCEFDTVCSEVSDAGAVYMGRSLIDTGNKFAHNLFRDIQPYQEADPENDGDLDWDKAPGTTHSAGKYTVNGVFLDDGQSGVWVHENNFVGCQGQIKMNGGRNNFMCENQLWDEGLNNWRTMDRFDYEMLRVGSKLADDNLTNGLWTTLVADFRFPQQSVPSGATIVYVPQVYGATAWTSQFNSFPAWLDGLGQSGKYDLYKLDGITTNAAFFLHPDWTEIEGTNRILKSIGNRIRCSGAEQAPNYSGTLIR